MLFPYYYIFITITLYFLESSCLIRSLLYKVQPLEAGSDQALMEAFGLSKCFWMNSALHLEVRTDNFEATFLLRWLALFVMQDEQLQMIWEVRTMDTSHALQVCCRMGMRQVVRWFCRNQEKRSSKLQPRVRCCWWYSKWFQIAKMEGKKPFLSFGARP